MATKTISEAGGNSNEAAAWSPSGVPGEGDDIRASASSGNLTIAAALSCRSIDLTGYTKTLTHGAFSINVGTSTAPPENKAVVFPSSGWTYTKTNATTSKIVVRSSVAATTHTLDFGGKLLGSIEVTTNVATTTAYKLLSGFTMESAGRVIWAKGTLETNNQNFTVGGLSCNGAQVRKLVLGSSEITILVGGQAGWEVTAVTNFTLEAGTSALKFTSPTVIPILGEGLTYYNLIFAPTGTNSQNTLRSLNTTCNNVTITGSSAGSSEYLFGPNFTINGKLSAKVSSEGQRLLVGTCDSTGAAAPGAPGKITATEVAFENVDFLDVEAKGASTPWTGTRMGDCFGNSGITTDAPKTRYLKAAGNFGTSATYSATSGGAAGASVPLPQDTIVGDANSGAGTYTINVLRIGSLDLAAFTRSLTSNTNHQVYGSEIFGASATINVATFAKTFRGRGSYVITSAGKAHPAAGVIAPGGSYKLEDAYESASTLTLTAGELNLNGKAVAVTELKTLVANTKVLDAGKSTVTLSGTAAGTLTLTGTNQTLKLTEAAFVFSGAFTAAATAINAPATLEIGTLEFTSASANFKLGALGFIAASLTLKPGQTMLLGSTSTYEVGALSMTGESGKLIVVSASTAGSAAIIKKTSGSVNLDYVSLKDVKAEGGATFWAGNHAANRGGTSGWTFAASTGSVGSPYTKAVTVDAPLSYWKMGEASGELAEWSGGAKVALSGSVIYDEPGPLKTEDEGAISFDGNTGAGQVQLDLSDQTAFTVEALLKWDVNGSGDDFALEHSANANSNTGFNWDWDNSTGGAEANTVSVKWLASGGAQARRYTFPRPPASAFHHVVVSIAVNGAATVWIDGAAVTATARESAEQTGTFASTILNLMSRNKASLFGAGDMAHLAVYSGALSKARVEAHFAALSESSAVLIIAPAAAAVATGLVPWPTIIPLAPSGGAVASASAPVPAVTPQAPSGGAVASASAPVPNIASQAPAGAAIAGTAPPAPAVAPCPPAAAAQAAAGAPVPAVMAQAPAGVAIAGAPAPTLAIRLVTAAAAAIADGLIPTIITALPIPSYWQARARILLGGARARFFGSSRARAAIAATPTLAAEFEPPDTRATFAGGNPRAKFASPHAVADIGDPDPAATIVT